MTKNINRVLITIIVAIMVFSITKTGKAYSNLEEAMLRLEYIFVQSGDGDVVTSKFIDAKNSVSITGYDIHVIDTPEFVKMMNSGVELLEDKLFVVIDSEDQDRAVLLRKNKFFNRGYDRFVLRRNDLLVHEYRVDNLPYIKANVHVDRWPYLRNRPDGLAWMIFSILDEFTLHLPGVGEFVPDYTQGL